MARLSHRRQSSNSALRMCVYGKRDAEGVEAERGGELTERQLKHWRRDEYTDRLTGLMTALEVVPENDIRTHISSENCPCIPALSQEKGAMILVHNSFDGRESLESNNKERGN